MKEIVTIQAGGFANFFGSHFWNFQDELLGLADDAQADSIFKNQHLDMDVLYRTGETQQGILKYTPHLVLIDFQGSLGSMSLCGTLYKESRYVPSDVITWTGNVSTNASKPQKKNLFLQSLDDEEHMTSMIHKWENEPKSEIQDKDIVDCLDNNVQYWTDCSKVHYHPQSLYELNGLWMDSKEFDNHGIGREAYFGGRGEEINERLRFFIEE